MKKGIITLFIVFLYFMDSVGQGLESSIYTVMFYNVENLFHPSNDTADYDDDFTPEGQRKWTYWRYHQKITAICKVIIGSNGWEPPDIVGICEIENSLVLRDIVHHSILFLWQFRYVHHDSPDHRGMDVALLYRSDRLTLVDSLFMPIRDENGNITKTREISISTFISGADTLMIAMNHWTSRYGGTAVTESRRIIQANLLNKIIDSISKMHPTYRIIAGGDFNDGSNATSIKILTETSLFHEVIPDNGQGTYKFRGKWERIDHVFIAGSLDYKSCNAEIITIPFIIEPDEKYTGMKPFRTYSGYRFNGGISDHLPLLLRFQVMDY